MILSHNDITQLKELIFGEVDEDSTNKCMECKQDNLDYCELTNICNKYGYISINTEKGDMLEDLFDTIEYLDKLLREGRYVQITQINK